MFVGYLHAGVGLGAAVQEWPSKTFHVIDSLLYPVSTIGPTTVGPAKTNFQKNVLTGTKNAISICNQSNYFL